MVQERFIPVIFNDDVVLPLFTEELRNHLKKKVHDQRKKALEKIKSDGWGITKFGDPNPEYYGDYTHHFYNHFQRFLNFRGDWEVFEHKQMSSGLHMRVGNFKDGKFSLLPLNSSTALRHVYDYFQGFQLSIENYGIDFYKMGVNLI